MFNINDSVIHEKIEDLRDGVLSEVTDNFNQIYEEHRETARISADLLGGVMGMLGQKPGNEVNRNQISFLYQLNKK